MSVKSRIKVSYPDRGFFKVVTNEHQKFPCGQRVYIRPIYERHMSHFDCDLITTVEYTYDQAFGGNDKYCNQYSLKVASWYNEDQLMPVENGETIAQARARCADYFGKSYADMLAEMESTALSDPLMIHVRKSIVEAFGDLLSKVNGGAK